MGTSLTIFRVFGIDVRIHWSFILILFYGAFMFSSGPAGPVVGALYGILVIVLLFACVTLHELGHALAAKYYKVGVKDITLLPIGGVASLERMPDKPMQEFVITLAGPLVNFALAIILLPLALAAAVLEMGSASVLSQPGRIAGMLMTPGLTNLLVYLVATNVLLGLFNLLPAFPMDGGRILRSLLAMTTSYVQATRIAVLVGRIMAVLLAVWGLMTGNIVLLLVAFFVYVGGGAEREAVESRAVLKYVTVEQGLTHNAVNLYSSERLNRAVDLIMNTYQTDYPVLDLSGKFIGVLTRPQLIQALRTQGPDARIVDVMTPVEKVPVVAPSDTLAEAWERMATAGSRVVAAKRGAEFLGLITLEDMNEVFQVMGAAMAGGHKPGDVDQQPLSGAEKPSVERAADDRPAGEGDGSTGKHTPADA